MNWGNVYEVEFEPPLGLGLPLGMVPSPMLPSKIAAACISEALSKALAQSPYPIASVKLILSGVQW